METLLSLCVGWDPGHLWNDLKLIFYISSMLVALSKNGRMCLHGEVGYKIKDNVCTCGLHPGVKTCNSDEHWITQLVVWNNFDIG